jgi:hypothetical protein
MIMPTIVRGFSTPAGIYRGICQFAARNSAGSRTTTCEPEGFRFLKIAACGLLLWFGEIENEFQFC